MPLTVFCRLRKEKSPPLPKQTALRDIMSKFNATVSGSNVVVIGDNSVLTVGAERTQRSQRVPSQEDPGTSGSHEERLSIQENPPTGNSGQNHGQESSPDDINYLAKTGYVLVINNVMFPARENPERTGSDEDVKRLVDLFRELRFQIKEYRNLERTDMMNFLTETSEKDFSKYDCFVCVILSHGTKDGIYGTDDQVIKLEAITSLFRRDKCPSLQGKPKIFLIQACRGTQRDQVPIESDSEPVLYTNPSLPADADFLICFASAPGHESYRVGLIGSWFISAVYEVFKEYAHKEHIMDMMLRVNNEVAGYLSTQGHKQMPCEICMLTKKVFFQPRLNAP